MVLDRVWSIALVLKARTSDLKYWVWFSRCTWNEIGKKKPFNTWLKSFFDEESVNVQIFLDLSALGGLYTYSMKGDYGITKTYNPSYRLLEKRRSIIMKFTPSPMFPDLHQTFFVTSRSIPPYLSFCAFCSGFSLPVPLPFSSTAGSYGSSRLTVAYSFSGFAYYSFGRWAASLWPSTRYVFVESGGVVSTSLK